MVYRRPPGELYGKIEKRAKTGPFHFAEASYPPGLVVSKHAHQHAVFCLTLRGAYTELHSRRAGVHGPPTVTFNPPDEIHSTRFHEGEARLFQLDIDPQWLCRISEGLKWSPEPRDFRDSGMVCLVTRIRREFHLMDSASSLAIEGTAMEMVAEMSRREGATPGRSVPPWIRHAVDLLNARFAEKLELEEIARSVGVHPVYFATQFRRHVGATVGQFVRRLRVQYAADQLACSDSKLTEIAFKSGFGSQSHFCRVFRSITGTTPLLYRRTFGKSRHRAITGKAT
jgi:AraC family transcriptional regulator